MKRANREAWGLAIVLTVLLGALPMALYAGARLSGSLPSEAAWECQHRGGNHGPWWDTAQGVVIYLSDLALVVLLIVTLTGSIVVALMKRRTSPVLVGLALAALHAVLLFTQLWFLFWTVD